MAGLGLLFGGFVISGWPLLRYLNHKAQLTDQGIVITAHKQQQSYLWQNLKFRVKNRIQIVEVHKRDGGRIYAVDFMAKNTIHLLQRV